MKILQVLRTLDPAWGGPVEGVRQFAREALKRGHSSEIVCIDDATSPWIRTWDIPVHAVAGSARTYGRSTGLDQWLQSNLERFDVVVINSIWMYFSYAVWKATRKVRRPYFLFIHGALDPWFQRQYPIKHLKKVVYWKLFEYKVLRDAAAVLFTTEEEMALAHNAFSPYECKAVVAGFGITKIPLSSSFDRAASLKSLTNRYPALRNRNFILLLSRIHEKKGIDILLRAFGALKKAFPHTALVIAGPGESRYCSALEKLARSSGIDNDVIFTGPLYGEAKVEAMRAADVYALPSHQENFGVSIVESLCCGTPVLISDKVNIWREVQADSAGFVEPDTFEGTTRLLERWASLNPRERSEMRLNATRCFATRFEISSVSEQYFGVIEAGQRRA